MAAIGMVSAMGAGAEGSGSLPKRPLGKTGERLSIIGMGGIVVMGMEQKDADRVVHSAIDRGVNYFDVAPGYGNGEAEEKFGGALKGYRDKVFLACKTGRRGVEGAREELERSLQRLQTDHMDLYQFHGLMDKTDAEKALAKGGAIEAFVEARKQGKVRFLGFSAHSAEAALFAMEHFEFDSVLFPINWVCCMKGNFGPQVIEAAVKKQMGILALKSMAHGPIPNGEKNDYPKCWYKPEPDAEIAKLALRFTLSEKITAALPPGYDQFFELAMRTARGFKPLTGEEREKLKALSDGLTPLFKA